MTSVLEPATAGFLVDRERFTELEGIIERGLATFVEVGSALLEIRDGRLYRETHGTFEDYCAERWNLKRQRAYELIEAASVALVVSEISDTAPAREAHAAALAPVLREHGPDIARQVWAEVVERAEAEDVKVTAELVREHATPRLAVHFSSETDDWATPRDLFALLDEEFGFGLDVCASAKNAKCESYFTRNDDGLAQRWQGVCWMNPPYGGEIAQWVEKAWRESRLGATVVCLVPARVDTGWWWDFCRHGQIRFLRGRLKFGDADTGAPFPSAVVVFGPTVEPAVVWWEKWRKD